MEGNDGQLQGGGLNRRGFLGAILAAGVAPIVITTPGLLMPVRSIVMPTAPELIVFGNTAVTYGAITREALRMLEENLVFARHVNESWDNRFSTLPVRL